VTPVRSGALVHQQVPQARGTVARQEPVASRGCSYGRGVLSRSRRSALPAAALPVAALPVAAVLLAGCGGAAEDAAAGSSGTVAPPAAVSPSSPGGAPSGGPSAQEDLAALERQFDARLGVHALDTGSGRTVEHRADERFAAASTLKALSAAAVLDSAGTGDLDRVLTWSAGDLVPHSPVTEEHVEQGLPLREVARAAAQDSDNTAANLLLEELGGPAGLQRWLRELGDDVTRTDRAEPALNDVAPGDERDTSTPRALATNLQAVLLGDALAVEDRELLSTWPRETTLTQGLVRAGVPGGWVVEDESGAAAYGTRDVVAVVRPPGRDPLVLALLSDRRGAGEDAASDDALLAAATEVVVAALGRRRGAGAVGQLREAVTGGAPAG